MLDWEADEQEIHTFPKEPNEDPKNSSCDRENEDCDHLDIPEDHEDDEDDFHDPPELHPADLMHQDTFDAIKSVTQATKHIMLHWKSMFKEKKCLFIIGLCIHVLK